MFSIDERVINQKTGQLGKVIGYEHELINNLYTVTLKVLVAESSNPLKKVSVVEDIISAWKPCSIA